MYICNLYLWFLYVCFSSKDAFLSFCIHSVSMQTCMCVCFDSWVSIRMFMRVYMHACIYVYTYEYVYVYWYACLNVFDCAYLGACMAVKAHCLNVTDSD